MKPYLHFLLFLYCLAPQFLSGQCAQLNDSTPSEQLISYLRQAQGSQLSGHDGECVVFAIEHLRNKPSTEATTLLIGFLAFRRPLSEAEQQGFFTHAPTTARLFPATSTLASFGPVTIPQLLAAIKNSPSATVQQNAVFTLLHIFPGHHDKAVTLLRDESIVSTPPQAERLHRAIRLAINLCGSQKASCEAAANGKTREPGNPTARPDN